MPIAKNEKHDHELHKEPLQSLTMVEAPEPPPLLGGVACLIGALHHVPKRRLRHTRFAV